MQGLGQSNLNHDFFAYNASNQIWNGSAFVSKVAANFMSYRIAATKISNVNDPAIEEWFQATAPANTVRYEMLERGATLADSPVVWTDTISSGSGGASASEVVAAIKADSAIGLAGVVADAEAAATVAATINSKLGTPAGASVSADVAAVKAGVDGVVKSGEARTMTRTGKTPVTYTETRT